MDIYYWFGLLVLMLGISCVPLGVVFSVLPVLPGPPVAMLAPLLVAAGLYLMDVPLSGWVWLLLVPSVAVGLVVTAIDVVAPLLGRKLGRTSRSAMVGSYYGLGIGLMFATHIGGVSGVASAATVGLSILVGALGGAALLFAGPVVGGFCGELSSMTLARPKRIVGADPPDDEPPSGDDDDTPDVDDGGAVVVAGDPSAGPPALARADTVGEILWNATKAGLAQGLGLLLTTGAKVVYGVAMGLVCALILLLAWLV